MSSSPPVARQHGLGVTFVVRAHTRGAELGLYTLAKLHSRIYANIITIYLRIGSRSRRVRARRVLRAFSSVIS